MNSLADCPHTLDLSRLRVLETKAREYNSQAKASSDEMLSLHNKLNQAERIAKNWKDRLSHSRRSGSQTPNHDDSAHPLDTVSIKEGLSKAEARVAEIEALIKAEDRRLNDLSAKSSSALTLLERCKTAMQESSEVTA
ncbi:MAG: hypothetical protein ACK43M_22410 [Allorhizobium sp.]